MHNIIAEPTTQIIHVATGLKTHKVVDIQHINSDDDSRTQHHKAVGFDRMHNILDLSNIEVTHHVHGCNMTINKHLRERKQTRNLKYRWYCNRPVTASVRNWSRGPENIGKTWQPELLDNGAVIQNHVYWCIDHCNLGMPRLCNHTES